jgi:hypothetical protein
MIFPTNFGNFANAGNSKRGAFTRLDRSTELTAVSPREEPNRQNDGEMEHGDVVGMGLET